MALVFPATPTLGQRFPANPGTSGVSQWSWDGTKWNTVPVFVRTNNQLAYNNYVWPDNKSPEPGFQITDLLADGNLTWELPGGPLVYLDDISSQFDGLQNVFTLNLDGLPFTPKPIINPNIVVVLGGIVQTPVLSYTISGPQITFSLAPAPGAAFCAFTLNVC
jgi:hypothetical protein